MSPELLYTFTEEASDYLISRGVTNVSGGIILGSGLAPITDEFEEIFRVPYSDIPHLGSPAAPGHGKELIYAKFNNKNLLVFSGRLHYYEGFEMWQVAFPVRILARLGGKTLISTGAAGGLNASFNAGDLMVIRDHINMLPESPLRGPHDSRFGMRFPDMSEPYDPELRSIMLSTAKSEGIIAHEGVYVSLPGPSLETKAEYIMLHKMGADCVAMSVVPEVIVGVQEGLRIAGLAVVANVCYPPERVEFTTSEDVIRVVNAAASGAAKVIQAIL